MLMKNLNSLNRVTGRKDQGVYREFEMALMGNLEACRRPTETTRFAAGSCSFSGSSASPGPRPRRGREQGPEPRQGVSHGLRAGRRPEERRVRVPPQAALVGVKLGAQAILEQGLGVLAVGGVVGVAVAGADGAQRDAPGVVEVRGAVGGGLLGPRGQRGGQLFKVDVEIRGRVVVGLVGGVWLVVVVRDGHGS